MISVEYQPEHLEQILPRLREFDLMGLEGAEGDLREAVADAKAAGCLIRSLITKDGTAAAIFGAWRRSSGAAFIWALTSEAVDRNPIGFIRCTRWLVDAAQEVLALRRMEATVDARYHRSCRWLERLGFQQEGLMRKFGDQGEDHYLYARVW